MNESDEIINPNQSNPEDLVEDILIILFRNISKLLQNKTTKAKILDRILNTFAYNSFGLNKLPGDTVDIILNLIIKNNKYMSIYRTLSIKITEYIDSLDKEEFNSFLNKYHGEILSNCNAHGEFLVSLFCNRSFILYKISTYQYFPHSIELYTGVDPDRRSTKAVEFLNYLGYILVTEGTYALKNKKFNLIFHQNFNALTTTRSMYAKVEKLHIERLFANNLLKRSSSYKFNSIISSYWNTKDGLEALFNEKLFRSEMAVVQYDKPLNPLYYSNVPIAMKRSINKVGYYLDVYHQVIIFNFIKQLYDFKNHVTFYKITGINYD